MRTEQNRTARLEARITHRSLAVVRRAAEIQGRSVSDFVVSAAQEDHRRNRSHPAFAGSAGEIRSATVEPTSSNRGSSEGS